MKELKKRSLHGLNASLFTLLAYLLTSLYSVKGQSVDLLTGRLQMSMPLGQITANDISIPINIYHHGGSLKVAEGEGDCGLGWNLNVSNFSVTRIVRGLPDEINTATRKGWLYNSNAQSIQSFTPTADDNLSVCTDEANDWNFLEGQVGTFINDSEPDLFYATAPGLSLQFIFGADGTPKLLNHQDVTIETTLLTTPGSTFTIKTNNGFEYTFGSVWESISRKSFEKAGSGDIMADVKYYTTANDWTTVGFVIKWKLVSITSQATGTTATFNYAAPKIDGAAKLYLSVDSLNFLRDTYTRAELNSITLKSYTASFSWSNSQLNLLTISESNTLDSRKVSLEYSSASKDRIAKSFLRSLQVIADNCSPTEKYSFDYQNVIFTNPANLVVPSHINWKKNWGQDFFGYPNGDANNKNLPTLYFYASETDGRRLRVTTIPGLTPTSTTYGQNRTPNETSYTYGALTKITYPAGGYLEVQYELNTYMDNSTNQEFAGNGMRVKKLISQGGEAAFGKTLQDVNNYHAIIKEYDYKNAANTLTSGLLLSPIKLGYLTQTGIKQSVVNLSEEPEVLYTRVKEKVTGQGSTVYEFNIPGVFPETVNGEWKATKSRIARKPGGTCIATGNIKNGYYTFPFPRSTNYDFKRGQLTKVTEYSETGTTVREKIFTYAPRTSNPTTVKGLRFEKVGDIYHYGLYELLTGRMEVITQEIAKEASQDDPSKWFQTTTAYTYNSNHMLQMVTTTLPDGTLTKKSFQYAKDFQFTTPPATDTTALAIKALNNTNRSSEIIEQITKTTLPGSTEKIMSAQLVQFRVFDNGRVLPYYIKILPMGSAFTEAVKSGENFVPDTDYKLIRTIKEYDAEGRVLTETDDKKNYASYHYAVGPSLPAATFYNSKAQQSVYEGFEMTTSFGLTATGIDFQYPAGWTGSKAITFTSNTSTLISSAANPIHKNGSKYRVSCWVYSALNKAITFNAKSGGATVAFLTLTNTINNKWNYLEGEMNVSSLPSTFTLEVITNATTVEPVSIDDIVFMPSQARIALQTILPFKGLTSATDDSGNSIKKTYDPMGRLVNTLDRNRNLVQRNEYSTKNVTVPKPAAHFKISADTYFTGTPITFTPYSDPCYANRTFAWQVDGIGQPSGPGNTLTYTFATAGPHTITLTTTNEANVTASVTQTICVEYQLVGEFRVAFVDNNGNEVGSYDCNSPAFSVVLITPSNFPYDCLSSVSWSSTNQASGQNTIITHTATYTINCSYYKDCSFTGSVAITGSASSSIIQVYVPNCQ